MYFWTNDYSSNPYLNTSSQFSSQLMSALQVLWSPSFTNPLYLPWDQSSSWKSQSGTNKSAKGSGKKKRLREV